MAKEPDQKEGAKRLIGALLRMPPKPHSEMKVNKPRANLDKSPVDRTGTKKKRQKRR